MNGGRSLLIVKRVGAGVPCDVGVGAGVCVGCGLVVGIELGYRLAEGL